MDHSNSQLGVKASNVCGVCRKRPPQVTCREGGVCMTCLPSVAIHVALRCDIATGFWAARKAFVTRELLGGTR